MNPGSSGTSSTPDLQTILARLAQYAPPVDNNGVPPAPPTQALTSTQIPEQGRSTPDPRLRPQSRSAVASPKPIDPATITTWRDGLRCVTKIAEQNSQFASSIKRLMKDQRDNETRWYSERQNLKQTQANRAASAAKANAILKSLNSIMPSEPQPEVDQEAELAAFDRKIYACQLRLENAIVGELKRIGVPFFGTDENLIIADGLDLSDRMPEGQQKWSPIVTESELMELRRKMVLHLEDLYRDW